MESLGTSLGSALTSLIGADGKPRVLFLGYFLVALRVAVVLAMTPVLYAMPIPARVRAALVLVLATVLAACLPANEVPQVSDTGALFESAFSELGLGATLGLGVLLAFSAFAVAGNLLDVQIGFGIAQVFDPVSNRFSPLLVSAFSYAAVVVFFLVDGHHALLRGVAYSLQAFPVGRPWLLQATAVPVLKQAGAVFALGFALAAPVVFCVLLVELALGVVSRNLPQINMLALGIPIKIVVGMAVLSLWFTGMGGATGRIYATIYETWDGIFFHDSGARFERPTLPSVAQPIEQGGRR
jgi:flagellar biosynthetic protein FliR